MGEIPGQHGDPLKKQKKNIYSIDKSLKKCLGVER